MICIGYAWFLSILPVTKRWATEFRSVCTSLAALLLISSGPWNPGSGIFSLWKSLWNLQISSDLYRSVLQITPHQESIRKVQTLWQSGHICKSFNARRCDGSLEQGDPRSFRGPYNEVHTKKRLLVTSDTDLANFLVFIWVLTTTTVLFVYICITCCVSAMFPFEMHAFLLPSFSDLAQKERF